MSAPRPAPRSEYLEGIFAPVTDERHDVPLTVRGELPADLHGMFVRNGPNPRFPVEGRYHWFDGDAMVHGVCFADGEARYTNRYVRSAAFEVETKAGAAMWAGIMEPMELRHPISPMKDNPNTDLVWHAGKLLALWYLGGEPVRLEVPSLRTLGPERFADELPAGMSAHPKVDAHTGEMMIFDFQFHARPFLRYGLVSAQGELLRMFPIEMPGPRFFHDIGITERSTIFLDLPMLWDPELLRQGKRRIVYRKDMPTRFGVIDRHATSDTTRWLETEACYVYHVINCYEDGDEIVVVACRVDDPMPKSREPGPHTRSRLEFLELAPMLHRWRLSPATGEVRGEQLDDVPTEFPRMNDRWLGRPARYCYNPRLAPSSAVCFDGWIKYDLERGRSWVHALPADRVGDEAVFAPRPGASEEDDGYLVSFVHDRGGGPSRCVVIDARTMEERASLELPQRIPTGFHATWIPGGELPA
ncbi:MAG: carotenoid oxygenase family protein [Myxococcales bacterium]|nr:carotenoid oxygenase family protein [Myxococcales bacterium]MCB9713408.1 carotenoid oxygenase family protein [Myxococcales bacterium]